MSRLPILAFIALAALPLAAPSAPAHRPPKPPKSLRLYVFDCGVLKPKDTSAFGFKPGQIKVLDMSVPCFLVVHPKGTLMWDVGTVPDSAFPPGGGPYVQGMMDVDQPLKPQLEAIGYDPADIKYIAFSHYHIDHTANANMFAGSTWLVEQAERDIMFSNQPAPVRVENNYAALKNSKTIILPSDSDYDVFGDGTVIIKPAPGHTPGHQVLFLKLRKTGPVLIAGDLYHYQLERTTGNTPNFEYNRQESLASRAKIEKFVKETGAQMWIEHDYTANQKLKKSPKYYE